MRTFTLTDDHLETLRNGFVAVVDGDQAHVLAIVLQLAEFPQPGTYAHDPGLGWFRVDETIGPTGTLRWLKGPRER